MFLFTFLKALCLGKTSKEITEMTNIKKLKKKKYPLPLMFYAKDFLKNFKYTYNIVQIYALKINRIIIT